MWRNNYDEEHQGDNDHNIGHQISRTEREMLGNGTTRKDANAKS